MPPELERTATLLSKLETALKAAVATVALQAAATTNLDLELSSSAVAK